MIFSEIASFDAYLKTLTYPSLSS